MTESNYPISIEGEEDELFYSQKNLRQIAKADQQVNDGKVVVKTIEELEAME